MVLCLKSEQCSPVVARLSPVCAATSVAFLFYNIAFVCFLYSAEQPLWMGQKKLLYSSLVCTSFKAEFLTTTLFCWTEIKKKEFWLGDWHMYPNVPWIITPPLSKFLYDANSVWTWLVINDENLSACGPAGESILQAWWKTDTALQQQWTAPGPNTTQLFCFLQEFYARSMPRHSYASNSNNVALPPICWQDPDSKGLRAKVQHFYDSATFFPAVYFIVTVINILIQVIIFIAF